jgi:hypothetical protein
MILFNEWQQLLSHTLAGINLLVHCVGATEINDRRTLVTDGEPHQNSRTELLSGRQATLVGSIVTCWGIVVLPGWKFSPGENRINLSDIYPIAKFASIKLKMNYLIENDRCNAMALVPVLYIL